MSALDTDIAFATMMARVARAHSVKAASFSNQSLVHEPLAAPRGAARLYTISIVGALAALSVVTIFAGISALSAEEPAVWIHRLIAISLAQSILFAAMVMNVAPLAATGRHMTKVLVSEPLPMIEQQSEAYLERRFEASPPPLPVPAPRTPDRPTLVGHGVLAGRDYAEYSDGSVEIETMLGRRRFVTLDTARTFVGA